MEKIKRGLVMVVTVLTGVFFLSHISADVSKAADLEEIHKRGVLRHLGIPYAKFVTGSGDGLDVEIMQSFCRHLGVEYQYVATTWSDVFTDLTGNRIKYRDGRIEKTTVSEVKGDIAAHGMTILPWREQVVNFSVPMFPSQVWLVAHADLQIRPIVPGADIFRNIHNTKELLRGLTILGKQNTCLDPALYDLVKPGQQLLMFSGNLNDLAPAVLNGEADATLLDVPDALIALEKWPGQLKIIGPISQPQVMGWAFPPDAPNLRHAFNDFLAEIMKNGTYEQLVKKYYPLVFQYYPEFLKKMKHDLIVQGQAKGN